MSFSTLANTQCHKFFQFGDIVAQYGGNYEYNQLDVYNWGADNRFWGLCTNGLMIFTTLKNKPLH